MKTKIPIILALLLAGVPSLWSREKTGTDATAAEWSRKGYNAFVEVGVLSGIGGSSGPDLMDEKSGKFELSTSHGWQFNRFLYVGAGAGMSWYTGAEAVVVPFFGNVRVNCMDGKVSPVLDAKGGYAVGEFSGAYAACSAGVRFAVSGSRAVYCMAEFSYGEGSRVEAYRDYAQDLLVRSARSVGYTLGVKLGFEF